MTPKEPIASADRDPICSTPPFVEWLPEREQQTIAAEEASLYGAVFLTLYLSR